MLLKEDLIKQFNLKFVQETKWNIVYDGPTLIMIFNKEHKFFKLKPKY